MMFHGAFNSILVKSHVSCLSWVSPVPVTGSEMSSQGNSRKKPRGSSVAETQVEDPWITSQKLYHRANHGPSKQWQNLLQKSNPQQFFFMNSACVDHIVRHVRGQILFNSLPYNPNF